MVAIYIIAGLLLAYLAYCLLDALLKLRRVGRQVKLMSGWEVGKRAEDIAKARDLGGKARLYSLEGESKEAYLVLPGGGYTSCSLGAEGFPTLGYLHSLGKKAYCLRYSVLGEGGSPIDDLNKAMRAIKGENPGSRIILLGYSAGAHLSLLSCLDEFSCPRPDGLILAYPYSHMGGKSPNILLAIFRHLAKRKALKALFGKKAGKSKGYARMEEMVRSSFPECYLCYGGKDFIAPAGENGEPLALSFLRAGVRVKQREFDSLDHAYGIGEGSEAEGWISEAADWLNQGKE